MAGSADSTRTPRPAECSGTGAFVLDRASAAYRKPDGSSLAVLEDFSFEMEPNTIVAVLGPSGCGKTTLLTRLAEQGSVSMVFQEPRLLPWYTVEENIRFVLHGLDSREAEHRTTEVLELVGLSAKRGMYPDQLSGGQRQRVNMARAFAYPARGILLDEPFQSLDIALRYTLIDVFIGIWQARPVPVVAVSHDPYEAAVLAGEIRVFGGPPMREIGRVAGNPQGPGTRDRRTLEIEETIRELLWSASPNTVGD